MNSFIKLVLICALGLMICRHAMASPLMIRQAENSTVVGPEITIGDVADLMGDDNGHLDQVRRLVVGKAAPANATVLITQKYIQICLEKNGFSLSDFEFDGADSTQVLTKSQDFYPSSLLPDAKQFVVQQTGDDPNNVVVKLSGEDQKMVLPAGKIQASFRPTFSGSYQGQILLTTELDVNHRTESLLPLRLDVQVVYPMVVTTKRVEKGGTFTKSNVAIRRVPTSKIWPGSLNELNYVLGRTAAMPIIPGTVLRVMDIFNPPVITHGSMVEGIVRKGNIELDVDVRAIQDGKAGDEILVENTSSHKVLKGKVLDEKTVLINQDAP